MYVIVGLGNPGLKYRNTRHNVGFQALDALADQYKIRIHKRILNSSLGQGQIQDQKVILLKPQTYMNLSGNAVRQVLDYYKIESTQLIVLYDDIEIAIGRVRVRPSGSAGSHNGMRSIVSSVGSDFARIRIGIGKPLPSQDLIDHVMSRPPKEERALVAQACQIAADAAVEILANGVSSAQHLYNGVLQ